MSLMKEQREQVRTAIVDTAVALFVEKGYEHVSVDDITKAVGVAKGTFYNYFQAKSDILMVWAEMLFRQMDFNAVIRPEDTIADNLNRLISALLERATVQPRLFKSALREFMQLYNDDPHACGFDLKPLLHRVLAQSTDFPQIGERNLELKVNVLKNALYMEMLGWFYSGKGGSGFKEHLTDTAEVCLYGILYNTDDQI